MNCTCTPEGCMPVTPAPPAIHCLICGGIVSAAQYSAWYQTKSEPLDEHDAYSVVLAENTLHVVDYSKRDGDGTGADARSFVCGLEIPAGAAYLLTKTLDGVCAVCKAKIEAWEQECVNGMASNLRAALPRLDAKEAQEIAADVVKLW